MSNEAALALIGVFIVKMCFDALGMAMDHGVRIGMRQHAMVCRCPGCQSWVAELKENKEFRLWFDELDEFFEKEDLE